MRGTVPTARHMTTVAATSHGLLCALPEPGRSPFETRGSGNGCTVRPGSRDRAPDPGFFARIEGKKHMVGICEASREIDLCTSPAFAALMLTQIDWADNRAVFVDCSDITFMDSSAFHVLVDAHRYAIEHGHLLIIRNLSPNCAWAIRLCDWSHELTIDA
jgi:anti-anti-sigma factor